MRRISKVPDVKSVLNNCVEDVCSDISKYAVNPDKDFVRKRKLPAQTLVQFQLNIEGNTLDAELYNNFPEKCERMTASAYEQQRSKLKAQIYKDLLYKFNATLANPRTMRGLRAYAIDGSDFSPPTNKMSQWYISKSMKRKDGTDAKGTCLLHGNFLYDLMNKMYIDINETRNERDGAIELMKSISDPTKSLVIMDKGYSGYNMIEHGNRYGGYYVIRFPISNTIKELCDLPDKPCDVDIEIRVSTKSKQFCDIYKYRHIQVRKGKKADDEYSENTDDTRWDFEEKCVVKFRACKFKINDPDSGKQVYEILVTNLPREMFSLKEMKKVYWLRWGIETSFKLLKYPVGAIQFHSKKDDFILQELYAHIVMYNAISRAAAAIPVKQSDKGWAHAVNFKMVAHVFRVYFRHFNNEYYEQMYDDLTQYRHMLRSGQHNIRLLRPKGAIYFMYRVS